MYAKQKTRNKSDQHIQASTSNDSNMTDVYHDEFVLNFYEEATKIEF